MKTVLIITYLISTTAGLVLMKLGGNTGTIALKGSNVSLTLSILSGVGLTFYIISFFLFTRIVVSFDLSYIFPIITGVVQVASLISAFLIFKERITVQGLIGALLIISGIIIMNVKIKGPSVDGSKLGSISRSSSTEVTRTL